MTTVTAVDRDPTRLTEFGDIGVDREESQSIGNSLAKWFWGSNNAAPTSSRSSTPTAQFFIPDDDKTSSTPPPSLENSLVSTVTLTNGEGSVEDLPRTLPSVLDRVKTLFGGTGPSKEADLKAFWMPDAVSKQCYECGEKFTTFRRRHHCRVCGQIFCSKCRSEELPGKLMGIKGNLKVCKYCGRVAASYMASNPPDSVVANNVKESSPGDPPENRAALPESESFSNFVTSPDTCLRKKSALGYQEELFTHEQTVVSHNTTTGSISDGFADLMIALAFCTERFQSRPDDSFFLGSDLIQWLVREGKCESEAEAETKANNMVARGVFLPASDRASPFYFNQNILYSVNKVLDFSVEKPKVSESDPTWVEQIHGSDLKASVSPSSTTLFLNSASERKLSFDGTPTREDSLEQGTPTMVRSFSSDSDPVLEPTSLHPDLSMSHISEEFLRESVLSRMSKLGSSSVPSAVGWHSAASLNKENGELLAFTRLMEGYNEHEKRLVDQLLDQSALDPGWAQVIVPLVHKIVEVVRPDVKNENDDMDIRQYVQIKKVPGGVRSETILLNGVACSKNVAHRTMSVRLTNPQILLLGTSLMYQRGESKFTSLEPLVLQEYEYLKNVVAKMMSYKPDIIMIEKTAARVAQDLLKDSGVTLIINVKPSVMERVARLTQAQIVPCMDAQIVKPRLGMCHSFYLRSFVDPEVPSSQKTLMFFDGCASHLGITVVLRGGSKSELQKVKSVIQFLVLVAYNFRLERSFLMDEGALPPSPTSQPDDPDSNPTSFKSALKRAVLYSSPFLRNEMPYLLTEAGAASKLRKFFPDELYSANKDDMSEVGSCGSAADRYMSMAYIGNPKLPDSEYHPFITAKITVRAQKNEEVQGLLADFRARGGLVRPSTGGIFRERLKTHRSSVTSAFTEVEYNGTVPDSIFERTTNSLDPHNHQRMAVLFSSYSPSSHNAPNYCMHPWVVNMDYYGRNDIPLGGFLERYCFRRSYTCPSPTCEADMIDHIRRFVHDKGCVQIIMKELSAPIPVKHNGILVWNWCSKCQQISSVVPLSVDGWSLSFAKYLELRFHGDFYKRRGVKLTCQHSLHHEHYQYFGCENVVVSFKYYPIILREIVLPPSVVVVVAPANIPAQRAVLIEEVSSLSVQGHGSYGSILEKIHDLEDQADSPKFSDMLKSMSEALDILRTQFRSAMDNVQELLADLKTTTDTNEAEKIIGEIEDKLVLVKVLQCKVIATWNARIQEIYTIKKKEDKTGRPSSKPIAEITGDQEADSNPDNQKDQVKFQRSESVPTMVTRKSTGSVASSANLAGMSKDAADGKKNPFLATLTCLAHQPLQFPFPSTQHMLLPPCADIPVIIYEKEPSSIIAYTLASVDYMNFMADFSDSSGKRTRHASAASSSEFVVNPEPKKLGVLGLITESVNHLSSGDLVKSMVSDSSVVNDPSGSSNPGAVSADGGKQLPVHPEFQFFDSTGKFYCKVYFADQFRRFRSTRLGGGEGKFIRSLTRCVPWAAKGGKSGSTFCKTVDDRFILKQMSRFEMQSFLDFGPHYFQHVIRTEEERAPTTLAKIFGVYRLGYKNTQNNSGSKMDILVMENLFHGRRISQKFDLKGSVRNRLAKDNAKLETDYVLLDENLLKMTCGCPLYIRPHSKYILTLAISNDTQFLAAQDVMDYSLLVGVDDENDELVVGIIDYIRTFTWDKKLEMVVKSSGILGGQGKLPTVVSPELYRARFCEAMSKYFLLVPDRWTDLANKGHD